VPTSRALAVSAAGLALLTACVTVVAEPSPPTRTGGWASVLEEARGQQVDWYMYGGDETLNDFVSGFLTDRLAEHGVTLNQVRITDTVDAVNKVLAEKQAGRDDGGSVDLVWVNGENFATGQQAGLWHCGYDRDLPNARYVDFTDPGVTHDFGVPVEGCESVWQQADSALVYDSAALDPRDVESVSSLFAWAERNPGRFTYPAPPDFTGSMAVRTFLYDTVGGPDALGGTTVDESAYAGAGEALWDRLNDVAPDLWRGGRTYPSSQSDVERLYGNGEIDAYLTYGPGAVGDLVERGVFPGSTREAVLSIGNIANNSFVAIPYNAGDKAGAMVLADELLDPETQLELFRTAGAYPAIDLDRLSGEERRLFDAVDLGPSVLPLAELTAETRPELAAAYVTRIEADWRTRVLQR
jgi:putative spermidine/putrescine transport system substrate-binding protein